VRTLETASSPRRFAGKADRTATRRRAQRGGSSPSRWRSRTRSRSRNSTPLRSGGSDRLALVPSVYHSPLMKAPVITGVGAVTASAATSGRPRRARRGPLRHRADRRGGLGSRFPFPRRAHRTLHDRSRAPEGAARRLDLGANTRSWRRASAWPTRATRWRARGATGILLAPARPVRAR